MKLQRRRYISISDESRRWSPGLSCLGRCRSTA